MHHAAQSRWARWARRLAVPAAAALAAACWPFRSGKLEPFEPLNRQLGIVTPFAYKASDKTFTDMPRAFADQLTRALFDTKRMRVIDPRRLDTTLVELKLPTGVPLDAAQVAAVCKQLKADAAVYGNIVSVQHEERKGGSRVSETLRVTIEAKLVLASTTEVMARGRATGYASQSFRPENRPPPETIVNAALSDAADGIAFQLVKDLQPLGGAP